MKIRLPILFLLLALPALARIVIDDSAPEPAPQIAVPAPGESSPEAPPPPSLDALSFLNKDSLHGTLLAIDSTGLHWRSPEALAPIAFKLGQVSEVRLDSHRPPPGASSAHRIILSNGDELPGSILSLDGSTLVLNTWYAGHLSIPRSMITAIQPLPPSAALIYQGPDGLAGWSVSHPGGGHPWTFQNGALVGASYGTIGRDVSLPPLASIQFDVVLRGNCQFSIGLYSERADNFGNCYMLQLTNGYTELQRFSRNGGSSDLGSTQLTTIMRHDKSHIEIRADKDKKSFWLLIDGKLAKDWTDPADFNGSGGSLIFSCQPGTFIKLSNIKVSKWNGRFEEASPASAGAGTDSIQLLNEDKVSGSLKSIQAGSAKFSSSYAELNIPLDRIQEILLASNHPAEPPAPDPSSVRAWFPDGGTVTMQLSRWDAKGCAASSPDFGAATFSPDAFSRILFNLSSQPQPGSDDSAPPPDGSDQGDQ